MNIFIPIKPTAQARGRAAVGRGGHAMIYHGKKQRVNEADLMTMLSAVSPEKALEGPLSVFITVCLPVPASWSKKRTADALGGSTLPTSRPDLDNYIKQVLDCMTKLSFWKDDAQICAICSKKLYKEIPGWEIRLEPIS